jgi:hypothetical protein
MNLTPSQSTNLMRRGLRLLFDPEPSREEKQRIFDYFRGRCAYCEEEVAGKHDFDHLISSAKGGANHVSNRVLSCKPCNAKHKRETDWQEFLRDKWKGDPAKLAALRNRIDQWVDTCIAYAPPDSVIRAWAVECQRLTDEFAVAVTRIRDARDNSQ